MKAAHTSPSTIPGQWLSLLKRTGVAAVLALAAVACTNGSIQGGANGGGGKGGAGGSSSGAGGTSPGFKLDGSVGTGGTAGGSGVCNSTSTQGCKAQSPPGCGDGINQSPEECDDGNGVPGDGCNGVCKVEPNWNCPKEGPCVKKIVCGDGLIGAGEVCDDGNTTDGDGCDSTCAVQEHDARTALRSRIAVR